MDLSVKKNGTFTIIHIQDRIKVISDLSNFKDVLEKKLDEGEKNIAVNFSDASYLYSGAISVLVTCYRMIMDKGGKLCIIEPQPKVLELLMQMNIDSLITIYDSEDDMILQNQKSST